MKICLYMRFLCLLLPYIEQIVVTLPTEYVHKRHIPVQNNAQRKNKYVRAAIGTALASR